ncbi:hypothetical protein [Aquimarina sp. 433]
MQIITKRLICISFLMLFFVIEGRTQVLEPLDEKDFFKNHQKESQNPIKLLTYEDYFFKTKKYYCAFDKIEKTENCLNSITSKQLKFYRDSKRLPIAIANNHVYYKKIDSHSSRQVITLEPIDKNSLKEVKFENDSIEMGFYHDEVVTRSGDIIVFEGYEGGGIDKVIRYTKNLSVAYSFDTYKDINDDYNVFYDENDDLVIYISQARSTSNTIIKKYTSLNNQLIIDSETDFGQGCNIYDAKIVGENIVLLIYDDLGNRSFMVLDKQLNAISYFDLSKGISNGEFIVLKDMVFFNAGMLVFAYDVSNNKFVWEKKQNNSSTDIIKTKNPEEFRGGKLFNLDNNHIIFLEGDYKVEPLKNIQDIKNCTLTVLNVDNGDIKQKIQLGDFSGQLNVINNSKNVAIYGHEKVKVFRKISLFK